MYDRALTLHFIGTEGQQFAGNELTRTVDYG